MQDSLPHRFTRTAAGSRHRRRAAAEASRLPARAQPAGCAPGLAGCLAAVRARQRNDIELDAGCALDEVGPDHGGRPLQQAVGRAGAVVDGARLPARLGRAGWVGGWGSILGGRAAGLEPGRGAVGRFVALGGGASASAR